jgi:hypothetical protein
MSELSFSDTSHQGILYWNAIYTQLALDALPGRSADDELAGLMPTIFERRRRARHLHLRRRPARRTARAATRRVSFR